MALKRKKPKIRRHAKTTREPVDKPPFSVPTMDEVRAVKPNGLKVVSTFSGCGGSCLGFRMAGFEIVWASEFIPAARDTYLANYPDAIVDARDIREVQPSEILEAIGMEAGELDVLEGSPPCANFSMAGSREKSWGEEKAYSQTKQRSDDLFWEYGRLLKGLQPKVFVAENVKGMVVGKAKGYFLEIREMLGECGYNVESRIVDAQWLGVPQHRERLIFVGVRNDIDKEPVFPKKLPYRYAIRDALPHIQSLMLPKLYGEDKRIGGNEVCPTVDTKGIGAKDFYQLRAVDRADLEAVSIEKYAIGREWKKLRQGEASAKYFQLVRPDPRRPCPTITQTAGVIGAAGVTHPYEPRKFTIPELKAICAFPQDFELLGSFPQQWERCGRAVPPLMMRAIAQAIAEGIFDG